jgi:hypothetical protein
LDHANIRLRHVRIDLHFCEIIRDLENHRGLQTGGDGLANIVVPGGEILEGRAFATRPQNRFDLLGATSVCIKTWLSQRRAPPSHGFLLELC